VKFKIHNMIGVLKLAKMKEILPEKEIWSCLLMCGVGAARSGRATITPSMTVSANMLCGFSVLAISLTINRSGRK